MTLNNLLNPADWNGTREERDLQLIDIFNVTSEHLATIRSEVNLIDRVVTGARLLHQRLLQSGVDPIIIPAQFTLKNLALLVDDGSYSRSPPVRAVTTTLKRHYRKRIFEAKGSNLDPTRTQLLREDIGVYNGNLYQARMKWDGFSVSEYDWLKDVRIPVRIGLEEAILLGIFFSHGTIVPRESQGRSENRVELFGRNCDFEFYRYVLPRLVRDVHNIILSEPSDARRHNMVHENSGGYTYNIPFREISSLALVSWLQKDMGMSSSKEDRRVPAYISTPEQRLGFLEGVIASLGAIYNYPDRVRMKIRCDSLGLLHDLLVLSQSLGYKPHIQESNRLIDYNRGDVATMVERGVFINPHHIKQSKGITSYSSPPVQSRLHYLSS